MSIRVSARRPRPGLRRRIESLVLRWQARLDAAWADRVGPWVAASVLFVVFFALALGRAHSFDAGTPLATYVQAAWLIDHGHDADVTVAGAHLLSLRAPIGFYPLAMVTRVLPIIPTLLGAQAAALALGAVPLWRIARQVARLRMGAAIALLVAYGANPAVNNLNLADFHPETLALPALLAAAYFGLLQRWRPFALACLLVVAWSAELGLVVAGLGLLLALEGHGRQGLRTAAFGVAWTVVAIVVLERRVGASTVVELDAFADYGDGAIGVLGAMLANPFRVVADLFAEANVGVIVGLFAPVLFLPVVAPRYLIPAIPLQAVYLVADVPLSGPEGAHFTVPAVAFCFVAAAFALARIGRRSTDRVLVDRRLLAALAVAAVGFWVVDAGSSPYREPWARGRRDRVDQARIASIDVVGESSRLRASPSLLPHLAERRFVYALEAGERPDVGAVLAGGPTEVVSDDRAVPRWSVSEQLDLGTGLAGAGYQLVYRAQGVSVYSRGGS
ncbi:hypothetical protein BH18ACT4_BH18ACT4_03870 [soil metagenome]